MLAVIGPSGVGKSSLVRAGVVASLARSGTPVLVTTPGAHPMDSLVGLKPRGRQTLVVDQAEEAVTLCTDPAERARYFAALAVHVGAGGALALSLRADHLGDFAPYPDIARVLEDGLYLLGPMSESGLRSAIEGPARRAGLRLEPGLVDLLVREVEGEPAALPLLSHALRETWERREGPTLTVGGYRATGGIRQAVARSAESVYDAMDATQRSQLRNLLLRLVMPTRGRRRRASAGAASEGRRRSGARAASSSGSWRRGWSASTGTPSRSRTRRWSGCGRGCEAGSTTTSTANGCSATWPVPPTPGSPWGGPTASSTGAPGSAAPWTGVTGPART